jgi:hypothetical protein
MSEEVEAILSRHEINHSEICLLMKATATHAIPRYNCCLSPIELAWAKVERCTGSNNVGVEFPPKRLLE